MSEDGKTTDPLTIEATNWVDRSAAAARAAAGQAGRPVTLSFSIVDQNRQIEFPLAKELNIGRLDAATATFPDLDLTSYGGLEKGVSRRHAKITRRGQEIFIEDLGSVNGTLLNGKRLTPYLQHPLTSGDEIQIGRLALHVRFG
jgi:pSer/pThr/pTyr-binding forkhead associated (FHA) protein